jgi:NADH:ubiquinone oxidoreductase subunit F (NADH-binding)
MRMAVAERTPAERVLIHVVEAPVSYVAGEATAAVHYLNSSDPRPLDTPPRMSERGVRGRPTLVQNVESLAYAALVARFGPGWYREAGRGASRGTALVTVAGDVRHGGVVEIELGTPIAELVELAGGATGAPQAVLLGGWFGSWADMDTAWELPMDPVDLAAAGLSFGCGLVRVLDEATCGVATTASIMGFLADASAAQCGPCTFGLRDLADATLRLAAGRAKRTDLEDIERWTGLVVGRGACRHPDGAAQQIASAMAVFGNDVHAHATRGRCLAAGVSAGAAR